MAQALTRGPGHLGGTARAGVRGGLRQLQLDEFGDHKPGLDS